MNADGVMFQRVGHFQCLPDLLGETVLVGLRGGLHIKAQGQGFQFAFYDYSSIQMGAFHTLSPRERQCLGLLARPMRPKEIASELTLSVKTVETYLASAKTKLGATSPLHAARLYDDYARSLPENLPRDIPRVEPNGNPNSIGIGPAETATVPQGREIRLTWRWRTAIIAAMSFALVLSVLVLIAGADAITRLAHAYNAAAPINR